MHLYGIYVWNDMNIMAMAKEGEYPYRYGEIMGSFI